MIIATAGHIDHGKTTLIRALTGVDTDRLKEEKARGISIELGYAYTPLPNGDVLGFVDVPGHERLIHTMLAGACGMDFALLVVAADDGIMPQTLEHLSILELLGISRCAVALTKADRVSPQRLQAAAAEVATLLADTSLGGAPIFPVMATDPDDAGTQTLRQHLHAAATGFTRRPDQGLLRLAVDRVFSLSGHGTVVTGTVFSGAVRAGDTLLVMPAGKRARVRSIHAQNRAVDCGHAGERCALNLAGVTTAEVSRGDWLADPLAFVPSTRIDARLTLLPAAAEEDPQRPAAWTSLHVHLGTGHRVARVVPLEAAGIRRGRSALVQLVFTAPVCASPGDRFVVRNAQATHTLGGGVVLDPNGAARSRHAPERLARLGALETLIGGGGAGPLLQCSAQGVPLPELVRLCTVPSERLDLPEDALRVATRAAHFVFDRSHWMNLRARALGALRDFHASEPDEPGPDSLRLRRIAAPSLAEDVWRALIEGLVEEGLVTWRRSWLSLPEHTVALSAEDQVLMDKLRPLIAAGGFDPPWVRELAALGHEPEERVRQVLRKSVVQGTVCQIVRDLFYDQECVGRMGDVVNAIAQQQGTVSAARYRDALGVGRKRAIQILEFFDRVGYTRRVRDAHVLRKAHAPGGAAGLQTQQGAPDASW